MPRDYITADGFHITKKCRSYLSPLIQGEDYPPFKNGIPEFVNLRKVKVPKKLKIPFSTAK
jgi:6-phosphofructokinase 1